jgi:hypothetical protein
VAAVVPVMYTLGCHQRAHHGSQGTWCA